MDRIELAVDVREEVGKGPARRARARGHVPAVLYGSGIEPVALTIELRALDNAVQSGANTLIDLTGPAVVAKRLVLIKELQRDPLSRALLHCDLFAVDTAKKLHVSIPIHFEGKAIGVEQGGVLEPVLRELDVTCLPLAIPDSLPLDVSGLDIGDSLHVSDLVLPEGVETAVDTTLTVIHVVAPQLRLYSGVLLQSPDACIRHATFSTGPVPDQRAAHGVG